mgnify:CR=1 FL=1
MSALSNLGYAPGDAAAVAEAAGTLPDAGEAELIRAALSGAAGEAAAKAADIIALNAGATIYVSGVAATLADGVAMAEDAIGSGQARQKLDEFIDFTQLMRGTG